MIADPSSEGPPWPGRLRPTSIRGRLLVALLLGAVLLSIMLGAVVRAYARQLAEASQDDVLRASLTAILDSASTREDELALDIPYSAFSMLGSVSEDPVFYRVSLGRRAVTGYDDLPEARPIGRTGEPGFATLAYRGAPVRIATAWRLVSLPGGSRTLTASVAQGRDGLEGSLRAVDRAALASGLTFLAVASLFAVLASRAAARPLETLARSLARRGPSDFRPVRASVPDEMEPLVVALNGLLARLKTSLDRTEELIAEAAHRVRTPLALVRTQADITLRRVEREENRVALREMLHAIDECSRAAGQLLDHAAVTFRSDQLRREAIDLAQATVLLVERLRPLSDLRDIALVATTGGEAEITVAGDRVLIETAMRNLLDNALKYAPSESVVRVRVAREGDMGRVTITDEGPGFPEQEGSDLRDRFVRGANARGMVGSGLGLTIAVEVVEAHGGRLEMTRAEKGGACVSLYFPLR